MGKAGMTMRGALGEPAERKHQPADERSRAGAQPPTETRRQAAGFSQGTVPISPGVEISRISKSSEVRSSLCLRPPGM